MRVAVILLVACKSAPAPRPPEHDDAPDKTRLSTPPEPAPYPSPPGFATSDLATITGGDLATYAIQNGKLVQTGTVTLAKVSDPDTAMFTDHVGQGDWADRDHLFVRIGDRNVVQLTAAAIAPVAVPEPAKLKAPKPAGDTELGPGGADVSYGGLVITKGEAWWTECAWGFPADGFQCSLYVSARLWPTRTIVTGERAVRPRDYAWPTAVPTGFVTREVKRGQYAIGGVTCEGQGAKQTIFADAEGEEVIEYHWVTTSPPRLVVIYGRPGYADLVPERWTLHAGCTIAPIATGTAVEPGPAGLWLGREETKQVVYRGADVIGQLPTAARVLFRPTE